MPVQFDERHSLRNLRRWVFHANGPVPIKWERMMKLLVASRPDRPDGTVGPPHHLLSPSQPRLLVKCECQQEMSTLAASQTWLMLPANDVALRRKRHPAALRPATQATASVSMPANRPASWRFRLTPSPRRGRTRLGSIFADGTQRRRDAGDLPCGQHRIVAIVPVVCHRAGGDGVAKKIGRACRWCYLPLPRVAC